MSEYLESFTYIKTKEAISPGKNAFPYYHNRKFVKKLDVDVILSDLQL